MNLNNIKNETITNSFDVIRDELQALGLPRADSADLFHSNKTFEDGAAYRIEIPTVNSADGLEALLDESIKVGLKINRVTETLGICRHNKDEIIRYVRSCEQYGCQLLMSPGPRASYDIGVSAKSAQGNSVSYRLRGQEQIVCAISDILRAIQLGVRAFVIYDEGLLYILCAFKKDGKIPSDIFLKISAHCGYSNPSSIKLLENMGANSVNPIRDLPLQVLHSIRQTVLIPIDCHVDTPPSSGGIIRFYDAPKFAEVLSPVHLKTGNSLLPSHGSQFSKEIAKAVANQALAVCELIQEHAPNCIQSK